MHRCAIEVSPGRAATLAVDRLSVVQGIEVIDQTCGGVSSNRSVPDVQKKTTGAKWFEQGALCAVAKRVGDGWGRRVSNVPENVMQLSIFNLILREFKEKMKHRSLTLKLSGALGEHVLAEKEQEPKPKPSSRS